jgi:hypothetical protein
VEPQTAVTWTPSLFRASTWTGPMNPVPIKPARRCAREGELLMWCSQAQWRRAGPASPYVNCLVIGALLDRGRPQTRSADPRGSVE